MSLRRTVPHAAAAALLLFTLAGCGAHSDSDELSKARHNLRSAPCGKTPAVCGAASVHGDPRHTYVGDWLMVSVCHLDELAKAADAAQSPITLFVEGKDTGNEPTGIDLESGTLTFILDRNDQNRTLWQPYLYAPLFDPEVAIHVSVGIRGERPLPRVAGANLIMRLQKLYVDWTTWVWTAFLVLFVVLLCAAAVYTDMLRQGPRVNGVLQPYNLGRSQMAWWFFLIVISYSFIWLVTGDRDTIPPSLLALMGISSATALASALITPRSEVAPRKSRGWWRDLVADDNGVVALDRLQIVVWTLVLSGIFLSSVIWDLLMPEFNATLLTLMGISSGTYIGFQLPQKSTTTTTTPGN
jgi:hypothetical protein